MYAGQSGSTPWRGFGTQSCEVAVKERFGMRFACYCVVVRIPIGTYKSTIIL